MQIALAGRPAIVRRAAVAGEALARERLVHHAEDRLAVAHQADQRAPGRHPGNEGLGAVDRIEHPDIFGVGALAAVFLADDAVLGKVARISARMAFSAARSAAVTGSKPPPASCPRPPARCGRTAGSSSPDTVASWSTKAGEIDGGHARPWLERPCLATCTAASRPWRTGIAALSWRSILADESRLAHCCRNESQAVLERSAAAMRQLHGISGALPLIFVRCGVNYCGAVAICRYRCPPWAFPP